MEMIPKVIAEAQTKRLIQMAMMAMGEVVQERLSVSDEDMGPVVREACRRFDKAVMEWHHDVDRRHEAGECSCFDDVDGDDPAVVVLGDVPRPDGSHDSLPDGLAPDIGAFMQFVSALLEGSEHD